MDSPEVRRKLMEIKSYALANPSDFRNGIPKGHVPAGDNPRHCLLNGTMRIVYSVEIQPNPELGQCHHLSISKVGRRPPNPSVVDFIMGQFGMGMLMDKNPKRVIDLEDQYALNIIQAMV